MARLDDYEFRQLPQELIDFKDDVRDIINNRKFDHSIVTGTPTYAANTGEFALYVVAAAVGSSALYVKTGNSWSVVAQFSSLS